MLVSDLLSPERVLPDVRTSSKKKLLELVSEALVKNDSSLNSREVFESLCARERLGSTGLGKGVAIPHGRINGNAGVQAVFIRLAKPLAYDAIDGEPVDLLFAPHHGSQTSSSAGFIKGFQPQIVFVSASRRSRYGHPHQDVLDRYQKSGARIYVTGWQGALIWHSDRPAEIRTWRNDAAAYWHRSAWSRQH